MGKIKRFKALKFIFLALLICPMLLLAGCAKSCNNFIDTTDYGSYTVNFFLEGNLYETTTSDNWGYIEDWPNVPERENCWFDGWYFYSDYTGSTASSKYRTHKDTNLYGRYVEYVKVDCVSTMFGGYIGADDDIEDHYITYMEKGVNILEDLEGSNVYGTSKPGHDYEGLYLNRGYNWCCATHKKTFIQDTTTINAIYDDCNPFGMIAGDFGNIKNLPAHQVREPYMYIKSAFNGISSEFSDFLDRFEIPTDGTEFVHTADSNEQFVYEDFYKYAVKVYTNSLAPVTRVDEKEKDYTESVILGLNFPYSISFKSNSSYPYDYYKNLVAKLYGFEDADVLVEYAKTLASTYEVHRQNLINNSEDTNEALNNGCFYTSNGSFVFPIAVKNDVSPTVLTYVIIDTEGRVSVWVHNMAMLRKAVNYIGLYFDNITINNNIYCKNTLFIKGATYTDEVDENAILNDELLAKGNYNEEENTLTIYQEHSLSEYSIRYDLGEYADNCDNSKNPTRFTTHDYSRAINAPETDGSILFAGWRSKTNGKMYDRIYSDKAYLYSLDLEAVWVHYLESSNGESVEFGYYPQSLKAENVKILDENKPETEGQFKGYYKGSDGFYYDKVTANLYDDTQSITLKNGTMEDGKTYFFKLEPILWDYVSTTGTSYEDDDVDTKGVISRYVLDYATYDDMISLPDGLYSNIATKRWCSDLYDVDFTGYNDTNINISYDECNPFAMVSGEFGEIADLDKNTSEKMPSETSTAFNLLGIKFNAYLNAKNTDGENAAYYHFYNVAHEVFDEYSLLEFTKHAVTDDRFSVLIDFNDLENSRFYDDDISYASEMLTALATLFGLSNQTVLKDCVADIAANCGKAGYEALANSYVKTSDDLYIFPFAIYNTSRDIVAYLIVDAERNAYIWVNDTDCVLNSVNYNNATSLRKDIENRIYCKSLIFIPGHTKNFTKDQLDYYVDETLKSPTNTMITVREYVNNGKLATDYAIAKGIGFTLMETYDGYRIVYSPFWLSSTASGGEQHYVRFEGVSYQESSEYCGVVPFLVINLTP